MVLNSFAKLISLLRISIILRKNQFRVPYSNFNKLFLKKLAELGYISSFFVCSGINNESCIVVIVSYPSNSLLPIQGLKLISTPSIKKSLSVFELKKLNYFSGTLILSTKLGILTKSESVNLNIGGIPILSIW